MQQSTIGKKELIILLSAMLAINSFAIDITLPAMDFILKDFHINIANKQHYIITIYLFGYSIAQIIWGPVSDRFGRRTPLLLGLILYVVTSILCIYTSSFFWFLFLRFWQGIGAAASRVLCNAIVRDLYGGEKMAQVLSIVTMIFMLAPVVAPALGQLLLLKFAWRALFWFLSAGGLGVLLWIYFRLPETLKHPQSLRPAALFSAFYQICTHRRAMAYSLILSLLLGGLLAVVNTAKQVYADVFGLGKLFPLAFAFIALCESMSCFLNSAFIRHFGMYRVARTALFVYAFAALCMFGYTFTHGGYIPFFLYMALFATIMAAFGIIGPILNSLTMEDLGEVAGTASAFFGLQQCLLGSLVGFIVAQQFNNTVHPLACSFVIISVLSFFLMFIAEGPSFYKKQHGNNSGKIEELP